MPRSLFSDCFKHSIAAAFSSAGRKGSKHNCRSRAESSAHPVSARSGAAFDLARARAAHDGTAVTVYGNDYETADGTCIRDYRPSCDRAVLVIAVRASSVLTTGA